MNRLTGLLLISALFHCSIQKKVYIPVQDHLSETIHSKGIVRSFHFFQPNTTSMNDKPSVIFVLHGGGGSGKSMIDLTRFTDYSSDHNFISVYPDGFGHRWNDGRELIFSRTDQENIDDIHFLIDLKNYFVQKYNADPDRFFIAGLSNGGFMVTKLACETKGVFAGYASIVGGLGTLVQNRCKDIEPVPILFIAGAQDGIVPYLGGNVRIPHKNQTIDGGSILSFEKSLEHFSKLQECQESKTNHLPDLKKKNKNAVEQKVFMKCKGKGRVVGYTIQNGGHVWPYGFYFKSDSDYGRITTDMDATQTIIDFFYGKKSFFGT